MYRYDGKYPPVLAVYEFAFLSCENRIYTDIKVYKIFIVPLYVGHANRRANGQFG